MFRLCSVCCFEGKKNATVIKKFSKLHNLISLMRKLKEIKYLELNHLFHMSQFV